jgi:hypothetical protein
MLRSYKFESRRVPVQEIESNPARVPFEIETPGEGDISLAAQPPFALKVSRPTRATRSLLVEWTAEVVQDGEGFRVVGSGREGQLRIPAGIAVKFPAVMILRASILNANGKAYSIDKVFRLKQ